MALHMHFKLILWSHFKVLVEGYGEKPLTPPRIKLVNITSQSSCFSFTVEPRNMEPLLLQNLSRSFSPIHSLLVFLPWRRLSVVNPLTSWNPTLMACPLIGNCAQSVHTKYGDHAEFHVKVFDRPFIWFLQIASTEK